MRLARRRSAPNRDDVRIVDLPERHLGSYLVCLEDWSSEMEEAGDLKARWYEQARDQGLRVKLALDEQDRPLGMIQYVPVELSGVIGQDLYMILCIWVHGYSEGVGDAQGGGIGTALLAAAEDDAKARGAKGIAAWGLHLPVWMKASWYKKHGYRGVDRMGIRELVWKPFQADAQSPRWIQEQPVELGHTADRERDGEEADGATVEVVAFSSGWCPAANLVHQRARRAAEELGPEVRFSSIDTFNREAMLRCGRSDEVLVDGKPLQRGAPPSYDAVRRKIARQLRRRQRNKPNR